MTFISSKLTDNKILIKKDPSYLANLKALAIVERERLLEANWKIRPSAGLYFKRSKVNLIETVPDNVIKWVHVWDFPTTEDRKNSKPEDEPA